MGTQAWQGEHEHTQRANRDTLRMKCCLSMKVPVKVDTWARVIVGLADDLFQQNAANILDPCFETSLHLPISALRHSTTAPPKRWIPPSPMSRDQGTFTVSRWRAPCVASVSSWVHWRHGGPRCQSGPPVRSHWAARWRFGCDDYVYL